VYSNRNVIVSVSTLYRSLSHIQTNLEPVQVSETQISGKRCNA
jgi:hypothetical protein